MKNEKGFVLPLMMAITFVAAYLLLMLATQMEVKVASYERTRNYMSMNLLEYEGLRRLEYFLSTTDFDDNFSAIWILGSGTEMLVNFKKRGYFFDFNYQIKYNGYVRSRNLLFCLKDGVIFLD